MFKFFSNDKKWLEGSERLYTLELCEVENCFDADALWDSRYGGNSEIINCKTKEKFHRLQEALNKHRFSARQKNEKGIIRTVEKVFTDVVIWMPHKQYQLDTEDGSRKIEELVSVFCNRHKEDFGKELWNDREPSYVVMPMELDKDKVIIQFGSSVFVPGENDKLISKIEIKLENMKNWQELPQWKFWQDSAESHRPAGFYNNQHGVTIGALINNALIRMKQKDGNPLWFEHGKGNIFVNFNKRIFGDGKYISKDGKRKSEYESIYEFKNLKSKNEKILIRLKPANLGKSSKIHGPHLFLEAYALPRLGTKKIFGLEGWEITMDEKGNEDPFGGNNCVNLYTNAKSDELFYKKDDEFCKIEKPPFGIKTEKEYFEINPSPDLEKYLGILNIPNPQQFYSIGENKLVIGRDADADIPLNIFANPENLKWQSNKSSKASLGNLGLSRRHAEVSFKDGKLHVQQLSTSSPLYIIRNDGKIEKIDEKSNGSAVLIQGEKLLIGCCVLCFAISSSYDDTMTII